MPKRLARSLVEALMSRWPLRAFAAQRVQLVSRSLRPAGTVGVSRF